MFKNIRIGTMLAMLAALAGCGTGHDAMVEPREVGELSLPLQTTSESGTVYGLDARLVLEGRERLVFDLSHREPTFRQQVPAGEYRATLSGYQLYEITDSGAEPLREAELASPNPTGVTVGSDQRVVLNLRFNTRNNEEVDFTTGEVDVSITVAEFAAWGAGVPLSNSEYSPGEYQLAVDPAGNAIAVWRDNIANNQITVYASRYDVASGSWTRVVLDTGTTTKPKVAFDAIGNAIVTWRSLTAIMAAHYDVASDTWATPTPILGTNVAAPALAVDPAGNAIAFSVHWSNPATVVAVHYDAAIGSWGLAGLVEVPASLGILSDRAIAMDASGNAVALWVENSSTGQVLMATRYDATTNNWAPGSAIGSIREFGHPKVEMDGAGNAIATWLQGSPGGYDVVVNHYDAASDSWGGDTVLDSGSSGAIGPRLAVNGAGNAVAVWSQAVNQSPDRDVVARVYDAAAGTWSAEVVIDTLANPTYDSDVGIDANGDAIVVWRQNRPTSRDILSSHYDAATGTWGTPTTLDGSLVESVSPVVAVNASSDAFAIWRQSLGGVDWELVGAHFY